MDVLFISSEEQRWRCSLSTETDGGGDGSVLTTLPPNCSVSSAVVASFLYKTYTVSLTGSPLSLRCGQFWACRISSCAHLGSFLILWINSHPSYPPCSSSVKSSSFYYTGTFHSCRFVHSNPAHLPNQPRQFFPNGLYHRSLDIPTRISPMDLTFALSGDLSEENIVMSHVGGTKSNLVEEAG